MVFRQWEQMAGLKKPPKSQDRRPVKAMDMGYAYIGELTTIISVWVQPYDPEDPIFNKPHPGRLTWGRPDLMRRVGYRLKWKVGKTYAVQRPDKKTVGRTPPIKAIRRERLGDISEADCLAEGIVVSQGLLSPVYSYLGWQEPWLFESAVEAYASLWDSIYGKGAWERMLEDDVWVLEFGST